jgi:hypothetical protein
MTVPFNLTCAAAPGELLNDEYARTAAVSAGHGEVEPVTVKYVVKLYVSV